MRKMLIGLALLGGMASPAYAYFYQYKTDLDGNQWYRQCYSYPEYNFTTCTRWYRLYETGIA